MLAVSLDGRLAPPQGGAAQLGGPGDRRVLEEALVWADACLIGAGTLRAHRCTALIRDQELLEQRLSAGRPAQPAAVVVSGQNRFPLEWPFFQQPLQRWLLSPDSSAAGFDGWVGMAEGWPLTLRRLAQHGFASIVLLGGARLAASLLAEDCVDEVQLTVTPRLLGGMHSWIPQDGVVIPPALHQPDAWVRTAVRSIGDDEVLIRFERTQWQRHEVLLNFVQRT